jgi:hypothetical protein
MKISVIDLNYVFDIMYCSVMYVFLCMFVLVVVIVIVKIGCLRLYFVIGKHVVLM